MLKINPSPTFEFDAQITVPGAEAAATIRITAKHKGRAALYAWQAGGTAFASDAEFLDAVFTSWVGPVDEKGDAVPYSLAALSKLLDTYPAASEELYSQYLEQSTKSRRKN